MASEPYRDAEALSLWNSQRAQYESKIANLSLKAMRLERIKKKNVRHVVKWLLFTLAACYGMGYLGALGVFDLMDGRAYAHKAKAMCQTICDVRAKASGKILLGCTTDRELDEVHRLTDETFQYALCHCMLMDKSGTVAGENVAIK